MFEVHLFKPKQLIANLIDTNLIEIFSRRNGPLLLRIFKLFSHFAKRCCYFEPQTDTQVFFSSSNSSCVLNKIQFCPLTKVEKEKKNQLLAYTQGLFLRLNRLTAKIQRHLDGPGT